MADLAPTYTSIRRHVGEMLGLNATISSWTAAQATEVNDIIASGLRKFYWPQLPDGISHEWSFLTKAGQLSFVSGTYLYDLAADFASLIGTPIIDDNDGGLLERSDAEEILAMRARRNLSGYPVYCAVRPKADPGATGTRYELMLYPNPDRALTATYRYVFEPDMISDTSPFPLGGAVHGETALEAILSTVETYKGDYDGIHTRMFAERLASSIRLDAGQRP